MVRKSTKLTSLFRTKRAQKLLHPCQFLPYCAQANTLSFRKPDPISSGVATHTPRSNRFTTSSRISSSSSSSLVESSDLLDYCNNGDGEYCMEKLVRGVVRTSERLFFEPNNGTSSLTVMGDRGVVSSGDGISETKYQKERKRKGKEAAVEEEDDKDDARGAGLFESSVLLALDSYDPYEDFKKSMKEMVEFYGIKDDWKRLEELLICYMSVNDKENYEIILKAFFDRK